MMYESQTEKSISCCFHRKSNEGILCSVICFVYKDAKIITKTCFVKSGTIEAQHNICKIR